MTGPMSSSPTDPTYDTTARHGRLPQRGPIRTVLVTVALALAVVLAATGSVAAIAVWQLSNNLGSGVDLGALPGQTPPTVGPIDGPVNILLVGSDSGSGNPAYGKRGETLNDVTILLHISPISHTATAISFPRDMFVPIPSCPKEGGGSYSSMSSQKINTSLSYGGLACPVLTVEALTGLQIPYAALIEFDGVVAMSSAIGGVDVCVASAIHDGYTGLNLDAGMHTLQGADALAFLRTRHGVGDGSDLTRISNQQVFLSALMRKVKSADVLTNPLTLYSLASAATKNMTLSTSLNHLDTMVSMAVALKDIPLSNVVFVQYPSKLGTSGGQSGTLPLKDAAKALTDAIAADQAIAVTAPGGGATADPNPPASTPTPTATSTDAPVPTIAPSQAPVVQLPSTITGQPASESTCSVGNG